MTPAGGAKRFCRHNLITSQSTGKLGNQDIGGTSTKRGAFARHKRSLALPQTERFKSEKKEALRGTITKYQDGQMSASQFK